MTDEELVDALKALAHPVRMRIMQALTGAELNVGEIDEAAAIGQPTLSQQLAVLRNAGLVKTRKEAKLVYYRIDSDAIKEASQRLAEIGSIDAKPRSAPQRASAGVANFARLSGAWRQ